MILRHVSCRSIPVLACSLYVLAAASPVVAQTLGRGEDSSLPVWRVIAALILCLALAIGAAFALKTRFNGRLPAWRDFLVRPAVSEPRLKLVETLRIDRQTHLSIVACDGRELLLATGQDGTRLLEHLPSPVAGLDKGGAKR